MAYKIRCNLMMIGLVLSFGIGCDQTTKRLAEQVLAGNAHSFLFDTVRLQFIKNSGAFLGFGAQFSAMSKAVLFLGIPIIFLICALMFVIFSSTLVQSQRILIALMVSGGIGNLIDRLLLGGLVTDFINVGIGPVRTGIFNVADMAIMAGGIGLVLIELIRSRRSTSSADS